MLLFCAGGKTPDVGSRTYAHIIREQQLRAEEQEVSIIKLSSFISGVNNSLL